MRIIAASAMLLNPLTKDDGIYSLQQIERMARISHAAQEKQTFETWEPFLRAVVMNHGDFSVTEHAYATVQFRVNRGVTHEMVRHRLFGITQESTRFVNYGKEGTTAEYIPSVGVKDEDLGEWRQDLAAADATYLKWLKRGYAPQIARDHLPQALAATLALTGNFRQWRHAFLMRTTKETHPDCRHVMIPLLKTFQERIPVLFEDIEPNARQIDNLRRAR